MKMTLIILVLAWTAFTILNWLWNRHKQKYIGYLVITVDKEEGQYYLSAKIKDLATIEQLKNGQEVVLTVEFPQKTR